MEKSKAEESPWEKKERKTGPKKKERVPFCQEKKKIPLRKWLVLVELYTGVQILNKEVKPSNQNLPYMMVIIVPFSSVLH